MNKFTSIGDLKEHIVDRFNATDIKIPMSFFAEIQKSHPILKILLTKTDHTLFSKHTTQLQ